MSVARSVARQVAKSLARSVAVGESGGGGPAPFSPLDLPGLQLYSLDEQRYLSSQLNDRWYLQPQAPYGTLREPLPACVADFDGTNDYASRVIDLSSLTAITVSLWVNINDYGGVFELQGSKLCVTLRPTNALLFYVNGLLIVVSGFVPSGLHHMAVTVSSTSRKVYIDGVEMASVSGTTLSFNSIQTTSFGRFGAEYFNGWQADARIYNTAKTPSEIAAIYNGGKSDWRSAAGVDTTGIVAGWALNDRVGTTFRDWSGNGNNLTIYNADTTYLGASSIHKTDSELQFNPANEVGYTAGTGGLVIPRDESDTANDVNGDPLQYAGKAPLLARVDTPCITRDAAGTVYLSAPHLSGSETVVSWLGSTTEPTISSGRIDWDNSTTLASLVLSDGTTYLCQEGTARAIADSGGSNDATIVGGDTANIWANKLAGIAKDVSIESTGVPGTYSVLNLNPNSAANFNGRAVPTDYSPSANNLNGVVTPTDTAFIAANGTKLVIVENTLTGTDLSNIEAYVTGT